MWKVVDSYLNMPDYFRFSTNREADKKASLLITQRIHNTFSDFFQEFGALWGTFKLQAREGSWLYEASLRRMAYTLQEPLKKELEQLQEPQIIVPLGVDETSKWCNSVVLVPKANG